MSVCYVCGKPEDKCTCGKEGTYKGKHKLTEG